MTLVFLPNAGDRDPVGGMSIQRGTWIWAPGLDLGSRFVSGLQQGQPDSRQCWPEARHGAGDAWGQCAASTGISSHSKSALDNKH